MDRLSGVVQDNDGVAIGGAFITVYDRNLGGYAAGVAAQATLWQDRFAVTPQTNPVTADADGCWECFAADGRYDLRIAYGGIVKYDEDIELKDGVPHEFDATNYGVVTGAGAGDQSAALQACLDAAQAEGQGAIVRLPPGQINIDGTRLEIYDENISIVGAGSVREEAGVDYIGTRLVAENLASATLIDIDVRAHGTRLQGFTIDVSDGSNGGGVGGVRMTAGAENVLFENLTVIGINSPSVTGTGILVDSTTLPAYNVTFRRVKVHHFRYGIRLLGAAMGIAYINRHSFREVSISDCIEADILVDDGSGILAEGCLLDYPLRPAPGLATEGHIVLDGPYSGIVSICNRFSNLAVTPYPAIRVLNFAHPEVLPPVVSIGDNLKREHIDAAGGDVQLLGGSQFTSSMFRTFTNLDATPSVRDGLFFKTNNGGATTIVDFDDGYEGQRIWIEFGDANTTIGFAVPMMPLFDRDVNNPAGTGNNWNPAAGDCMECVFDGTNWRCDCKQR